MNRTSVTGGLAVVAACACVLLTMEGCGGGSAQPFISPSVPSASSTAVPTTAATEITAARPAAQFPQDARAQARAVRLEVAMITNPAGQGLALTVAVEAAGTSSARPIEVGRVSPYPSDRGGVFTLPLRGEAADLARTAATVLVVSVASVAEGEPLRGDVRLVLAAGLAD